MTRLDLRTRLLAGIGLVAVVQIAVAVIVVTVMIAAAANQRYAHVRQELLSPLWGEPEAGRHCHLKRYEGFFTATIEHEMVKLFLSQKGQKSNQKLQIAFKSIFLARFIFVFFVIFSPKRNNF